MEREKIVDGYSKVNVILEDIKLDIGKLFWNAARMTWIKLQKIDYDYKNEEVIKLCKNVANNRALPTPKESIIFSFRIENISRVALAQITRGRVGWWYNVESQMPQKLEHGVTIPTNIYNNEILGKKAIELTKKIQEFYDEAYSIGIPPQDCRYMTLHGQQTSLVVSVNYAALPGFFLMRAENGLTDELNLISRLFKLRIKEKVFDAYNNNLIDDLDFSLWEILLSKLDCLGAKEKKCLNFDKVFGNTGRFKSIDENIPEPNGKIKCDYDFKKSAWYLELQKLPDVLLFDGEKEMIERWKNTNNLL